MKISMSGAGGFLGSALMRRFARNEWDVTVIGRDAFRMTDDEFISSKIEGADAIIHVAGAPISRRWTSSWKKEMYDSRVFTTRKIAQCINRSGRKPGVFINVSAVGIYDSLHDHTEASTFFSGGFLGKLCQDWEKEAAAVQGMTRLVIFRNGLVLGGNGGALKEMKPAFSIGLGGKIGTGRQPVSFIHIEDMVNAYLLALENTGMEGVYNAVTPYPTTNAEFTKTLARSLKQSTFMTVPTAILKLRLGEGVVTLLEGQKVLPERMEKAGFRWKYPTIQNALYRIYG